MTTIPAPSRRPSADRQTAKRDRGRLAVVLFFAGLVLQAPVLWLRGTTDVPAFESWARWAVEFGVIGAYQAPIYYVFEGGFPPIPVIVRPDYPPLAVVVLAAFGHLYRWIEPGMGDTRTFIAMVKLPGLLATAALLPLLFWLRSRIDPEKRPWSREAIVAAFWLNPALILAGPLLGYVEALFWTPGTASLILASYGHPGWAGVLFSVSLLMKPQGAFFALPLATILFVHRRNAARAAAGFIVTTAVVVAPFIPNGNAAAMVREVLGNAVARGSLLGQATNVWWIVTHAYTAMNEPAASFSEALRMPVRWIPASVIEQFVGFDIYNAATGVVLGIALLLAWRVRHRRDLAAHAAMGALVVHAYVMFAVGVHENHLVAAVPMLGLAAMSSREFRPMFWLMSAAVTGNLIPFYGFGQDFDPSWARGWGLIDAPLLLSIANLALFAAFFRSFWRFTDRPLTPGQVPTHDVESDQDSDATAEASAFTIPAN